jgi:hypothetical protein
MPTWNEILREAQTVGGTYDVIRRRYLKKLHDLTGRNVIIYYSGWLQAGDQMRGSGVYTVNDGDKNGLMATIHQLDRSKGLDLFLHTPGGDVAATESLVEYLRTMFGTDIRAIVPQLAMSAGTMIALSCKEIVMGKHSSLGPIDPQIGGVPAHGIIEEFQDAFDAIKQDPAWVPVWQPIIAKYHPTLVGECAKAIAWAGDIVKDWLVTGMFDGDPDADTKADGVIAELADHALTLSHARHISMKKAKDIGLNVVALEDNQELQDAVLTVHHACVQTFSETGTVKMIENHEGIAYVQAMRQVPVPRLS